MQVSIDKKYKLDLIAAKDSGRYAMHGVLIEDTGNGTARAVATDGRKLVVLSGLEASGNGVARAVVPADAWKFARGGKGVALRARPGTVTVEPTELPQHDGHHISDPAVVVKSSPGDSTSRNDAAIEGEFPRYTSVMPDGSKVAFRVSFNAQYLAQISDALGVDSGVDCVTLEFEAPDKPIRVVPASGAANAVGVLMPVVSEGGKSCPAPLDLAAFVRDVAGSLLQVRAGLRSADDFIRRVERLLVDVPACAQVLAEQAEIDANSVRTQPIPG